MAGSSSVSWIFGPIRDVVMIDATRDKVVEVTADDAPGEPCVAQADRGPRRSPGYVFLVLRSERMQPGAR